VRCGEDAIAKVQEIWKKLVPRLLDFCKDVHSDISHQEDVQLEYKALMILDEEL